MSVMVVAEISSNHGGSFDKARRLIDEAKFAGADAVKLQTFTPDCMTIDINRPEFKIKGGLWDGYKLYDLYKHAATPWEWHDRLFHHATEQGLECFSSPFSKRAVEFLELFAPSFYKIASFEITDIGLIRRAAETGKRLIMSTGCATYSDIVLAINAATLHAQDITLLHCVSEYPAIANRYNLQRIAELQEEFDLDVGLSDHSLSLTLPVAAVALGATVVEKHLKLTGETKTLDAAFSLEPMQFKIMTQAIRETEAAMEVSVAKPMTELKRSLYVVDDIGLGGEFTERNLRSIRPAGGAHPVLLEDIIGRKASQCIARGTPLSIDMVVAGFTSTDRRLMIPPLTTELGQP